MIKSDYHIRRNYFIDLLGGKCVKCGCEDRDRLEFDHKDRKTKSFVIGQGMTNMIETVLKEIEKCQLLCDGCHKEKTKDELGRVKHGTISMYRHYHCRCDECRKIWNESTKKWKKKCQVV